MCTNEHVKSNFPHSHKLFLQKIFLKIKLRKFLQKCLTQEEIVISTTEVTYVCLEYSNFRDANSIFMISDFNVPSNAFGTAELSCIVGVTAILRLLERKTSTFL